MFFRFLKPRADLEGDGVVLSFRERTAIDRSYGIRETITYDICLPGSGVYAGYISLRLGESPEIYYLGHIGYRVEEPFRGRGLAGKAVRALYPVIRQQRMNSLSITTDVDNIPSRKTCEKLGCVLENIVPVPPRYRPLCMNSPAKCRYILLMDQDERTLLNEHTG